MCKGGGICCHSLPTPRTHSTQDSSSLGSEESVTGVPSLNLGLGGDSASRGLLWVPPFSPFSFKSVNSRGRAPFLGGLLGERKGWLRTSGTRKPGGPRPQASHPPSEWRPTGVSAGGRMAEPQGQHSRGAQISGPSGLPRQPALPCHGGTPAHHIQGGRPGGSSGSGPASTCTLNTFGAARSHGARSHIS